MGLGTGTAAGARGPAVSMGTAVGASGRGRGQRRRGRSAMDLGLPHQAAHTKLAVPQRRRQGLQGMKVAEKGFGGEKESRKEQRKERRKAM